MPSVALFQTTNSNLCDSITSDSFHDADHSHKRLICIPIDDSIASDKAIDWALLNTINHDSDVIALLHVREIPKLGAYAFPYMHAYDAVGKLESQARLKSHQLLKSQAKKFKLHQIPVRCISLRGDVKEELQFKMNQLNPALTILYHSSNSKKQDLITSTVNKFLSKSITSYLIHHLKSTVLVIPDEQLHLNDYDYDQLTVTL
ncbi:hypothetical protein BC833DRAFT_322525 [Globomyces pollinis-pini]|nr:hypothetical protein BC833DRAFT_322525 [Globomyces pollinis-pini]